MISFTLKPYVGALPITFDMDADDVAALLGPPDLVRQTDFEQYSELRGTLQLRYSARDTKVQEILLLPNSVLRFEGADLFSQPCPVDYLMQFDAEPYEHAGFVLFAKLGIAISGCHSGETEQEAIMVLSKRVFDDLRRRSLTKWRRFRR